MTKLGKYVNSEVNTKEIFIEERKMLIVLCLHASHLEIRNFSRCFLELGDHTRATGLQNTSVRALNVAGSLAS